MLGDDPLMDLAATLYSAGFAAAGSDIECQTVRVGRQGLARLVNQLRADSGVVGAAVAMPCTVEIASLLDGLGPEAQAIKAANTVTHRAGALVGWNTERGAFGQALEEAGFSAKGRTVLLLGAGGSARACADALRGNAEKLWVSAPDLQQARMLCRDLELSSGGATPLGALSLLVKKADLIVNASPIGSDGSSVVFPVEWIAPGQFVFDLVCQPVLTPLVRGARERGARAINGLTMLLLQSLSAIELWTGRPAPEPAMRSSLERAVLERLSS